MQAKFNAFMVGVLVGVILLGLLVDIIASTNDSEKIGSVYKIVKGSDWVEVHWIGTNGDTMAVLPKDSTWVKIGDKIEVRSK